MSAVPGREYARSESSPESAAAAAGEDSNDQDMLLPAREES
jgi:hypothetical protein